MARALEILVCCALLHAGSIGPARAEIPASITLGVLTDMSGPYSDSSGAGSVVAARMAADEFVAAHPGVTVSVVAADHQNKADIGSTIARQWVSQARIDAIIDVPTSPVGLAVNDVVRGSHTALIASSTATSDLTGKYCSPNTVQWTIDTWAIAQTLVQRLVAGGARSFYFVGTNNALGHSLVADATSSIRQLGARVAGEVFEPMNTSDQSAILLGAAAAKADVIMLATAGGDTASLIKQAGEFGLRTPNSIFVPMLMSQRDVDAVGQAVAQGLIVVSPFDPDLDAATRNWSGRYAALNQSHLPTAYHAGVYSSVKAYLEAVAAAGTTDGAAVVAQMKRMRFHDDAFGDVVVRADGRATHAMYVFRVKAPAEPGGLFDMVGRQSGEDAFRPVDQGGCPLLDQMRP